ncbi:MAG: hypothetical protein VKO21_12110 [Candidatus Sericytochromatia bacterium]|nr:hypothetical protein [Candidatus Sericytochromatia bacterium]
MISVSRIDGRGALALAAALLLGTGGPAHALLGFEVDASLTGGFLTQGGEGVTSLPVDADAYVSLPVLAKAAVHGLLIGDKRAIEATARFEPLPLPLISLRPGVGVMQQDLIGTGGLSLYAGLGAHVGLPLIPVSVDAEIGAGLGTGGTVTTYGVAGTFFPLPLVPLGLTAKVRQYQAGESQVSAALAGLRLSL